MCIQVFQPYLFDMGLLPCSTATEIDESSVMQLAEMGFPLEACRKAVYYTGNMGAEMAFNWIIAHMEEPGRTMYLEITTRHLKNSLSLP